MMIAKDTPTAMPAVLPVRGAATGVVVAAVVEVVVVSLGTENNNHRLILSYLKW